MLLLFSANASRTSIGGREFARACPFDAVNNENGHVKIYAIVAACTYIYTARARGRPNRFHTIIHRVGCK